MIRSQEEGGLCRVRYPEGNVLISDTALRDKFTFNLKPIPERHKQVCGSEMCTMMEYY